ncbi:MAG: glycoside hydrolase family 1 protein [Alicyclobacillaceae bacterium]|nr:glycoside hydrolase family 1 protein [Alicyclobacillaceae bacterium]
MRNQVEWPSEFPQFLWGTATASHQVEGGNRNDWTLWEDAGRIKRQEKSGQASGHWERAESDFSLFAELGVNAYRFSVEWSRVEPRQGEFDVEALSKYRQMVQQMRDHGMEPCLTLHHFTLPQWFAMDGGFLQPDGPRMFLRYVRRVVETMGSLVRLYVTINEPMVYAVNSYLYGVWPPGQHNLARTLRVSNQLIAAHKGAYHLIKTVQPGALVGLAHHINLFEPWSTSPADVVLARTLHHLFNRRVILAVGDLQDYLGINYYTRSFATIRHPFTPQSSRGENGSRAELGLTDMGWDIYPEGLEQALLEARAFNRPILITENGISTPDDALRIRYLDAHLDAMHRAIEKGVNVRGYFYWSALDNFEWDEGFAPRFGLIEVNYDTMERVMRKSAYHYRDRILQSAARGMR